MAARALEIQARLRAPAGKWPVVPGTLHVSASSLDELRLALSGHVGSDLRVVSVFEPDEDDWVAVNSLDDIPDTAKLRLEPAQPLPDKIVYDAVTFVVGEAGAVSPIAYDATGAVIHIAPGALSFHLQHNDALEGWLTVDERTGALQGRPTRPCRVAEAEVVVSAEARQFWVCHIAVHADEPTDSRWVDDEDRIARGALLRDCIVDAMRQFGVALAPSDAAVEEHKNQALVAQGFPEQTFPFSKRIPLDNDRAPQPWRDAHAQCSGYFASCQRLCDELRKEVRIGECQLAQINARSPAFLMLGLSEAERARCEQEAQQRIKDAITARRRAEEAALLPEGRRRASVKSRLVSKLEIQRTEKAYKLVVEAMDGVVLPLLRQFMKGKLREFQRDVVDVVAARFGLSSEEFTDENRQEYRELINSYMDQPRWDYLERMTEEEKAELLAHCRNDGAWRFTAILALNFENNKLNPVAIWDETALCASAQAIKEVLSEEQNKLIWGRTQEGAETDSLRTVRNSIGHKSLLDRDFDRKFRTMMAAVQAIGGTAEQIERLRKLRGKVLEIAPAAKNTWDEVLQNHRDHDEAFVMLTEHQFELFERLRRGKRLRVEAPAGSGKTLICVKLVVDHVRLQEQMPGSRPVLLLVHSKLLQEHGLLPRVCSELGVPLDSVEWIRPGLARVRTADGGCAVISSVNAFTVELAGETAQTKSEVHVAVAAYAGPLAGDAPMFSYAVVDEGHQVFSVAHCSVDGQSRFQDAARVREVLESCLDVAHGRLLVFHDQSHQRVAMTPEFPIGLEQLADALKYMVRITAAVRDLAMPFCRNLQVVQQKYSEGRATVYPLENEKIVGEPIAFVDVDAAGTEQGRFLGDVYGYCEFLHSRPNAGALQTEIESHDRAYAVAIAQHVNALAARYSSDASPFREDLVAVLLPRSGTRFSIALREAVIAEVIDPHVRQALAHARDGEYRKDGLFWGGIEDFVGMERPLVLVSGFRHPAYLLTKDPKKDAETRIDPLLYQAITRCTYCLAIIEPAAKYFGRHHLIHQLDGANLIPYSTDEAIDSRLPKKAFWDPERSSVQFVTNVVRHASAELRADRDFMLEAVKQTGLALEYAAAELRADRDLVLEAVRQHYGALKFAAAELRADRDFMLEAVRQTDLALQYAAAELRADHDFLLEAVRRNGRALEYAAAELRADHDLVLEAVRQEGRALGYTAAELHAGLLRPRATA